MNVGLSVQGGLSGRSLGMCYWWRRSSDRSGYRICKRCRCGLAWSWSSDRRRFDSGKGRGLFLRFGGMNAIRLSGWGCCEW